MKSKQKKRKNKKMAKVYGTAGGVTGIFGLLGSIGLCCTPIPILAGLFSLLGISTILISEFYPHLLIVSIGCFVLSGYYLRRTLKTKTCKQKRKVIK